MSREIQEGATNCVVECAQAKKGQSILVLNEEGGVDNEVSEALASAAEKYGADVRVVWGETIPKTSSRVPESVIEALLASDVAIVTYPSLRREILHPHLKQKQVMRSGNAARTAALMASEWARFPYSLEQMIINKLDEIMEGAKSWSVTTPKGTDIRGRFQGKESVVAGAYFERDDGNTRFSRSFPGGVHTPFNSVNMEGVVVAEHLSGLAASGNAVTVEQPFRVEIKNNRTVAIGGEDEGARILKREIEERAEGAYQWVDSWHAGTNPKTVVPWDQKREPRVWWNYAHWSPLALHFHLGRTVTPISLCCFQPTVQVDGRKIYENGRLAMLDEIEGISRYSEKLFDNNPLPMWNKGGIG